MTEPAFTPRPYRHEDFEFVYHLGKSGLGPYVERLFGPWVDAERRAQLAQRVLIHAYEVIADAGADGGGNSGAALGFLSCETLPTHVSLHQIFITPAQQRRGLGGAVVRQVQRRAQMLNLPLRLRVFCINPAHELYRRLGFTVVEQTPERFFMEWRPEQ